MDVTIGEDSATSDAPARKERPIWMMESTVTPAAGTEPPIGAASEAQASDVLLDAAAASQQPAAKSDDIMSVLLAHEKKANSSGAALRSLPQTNNDSDSNSDDINPLDTHNDIGRCIYFLLVFSNIYWTQPLLILDVRNVTLKI